jgi:MoaD family protein
MQVTFYATLRRIVGGASVAVDLPPGATVQQLLDAIIRCYPAIQSEMLDEAGHLLPHVHIFVNGRESTFMADGLESVIPDGARIGVFPAVAGG